MLRVDYFHPKTFCIPYEAIFKICLSFESLIMHFLAHSLVEEPFFSPN